MSVVLSALFGAVGGAGDVCHRVCQPGGAVGDRLFLAGEEDWPSEFDRVVPKGESLGQLGLSADVGEGRGT